MRSAGAAVAVLLAAALPLLTVGPQKVAARGWNPDDDRIKRFNEAMTTRYGVIPHEGNPAAAFDKFKELADGPVDAVTVQCWYEMGKIRLFGYDSFYFWRKRDAAEARDLFKKAADRNHAPAQFYLSFVYTFNDTGSFGRDAQKAIAYLKRAAALNYVPAILAVAYRLLYGIGCAKDVKAATALYKKASRLSRRSTDALTYMTPSDDFVLDERSVEAFKRAASVTLQSEEKQKKEAMRYWESKAAEGDGLAMYEMGKLLENEPAAESTVAQLYRQASDNGVVAATRDLGVCYMNGIGVPQNAEKAVQYLTAAAEQGDHEASKYLGYLYYTGVERPQEGKPVKRNDELAARHFAEAAKHEVPEALYFMGEILSKRGKAVVGIRPQHKLAKALAMYRAAADHGLTHALSREAEMLERGSGAKPNPTRVAMIYKSLAEGPFTSTTITDSFYAYVDGDYLSAFLFNALAAFAGVQVAQLNLGHLFVSGRGLKHLDGARSVAKSALSQCFLQGDPRALRLLGTIAEREGQLKVAAELYSKGFKGGDIECLDPLANILASQRATWRKAIALLEHKQYRRARNTDGTPPGVHRTLDGVRTWWRIKALRAKRAIAKYTTRDADEL
ncbi:SEL-1-LIKE PROTEIN, putative [Babesia bigemina]|uniref:SEL-1-LIKE PROTEIN, putative n=1 Tax=Babesia bigemina TaxID=5866 RepID=A0A061DE21_BABBI|nr:SEL-1-LIKE PROTEIN, putative [Babesia bigemina]CDR96770.1 SEL-1-LIKE PROTEIN, putative [Babesia bigemina]|eukprot:XP_012768956.1 SEL-1-LIKE PROTEIN, putative [Babesia bigemina]